MKIVIDTNVLMAGLIKNSIVRTILFSKNIEFFLPEYSINEMADAVLKVFSPNGKIPKHLKPKYLPMRPQEVKEAYCTNAKAKMLLGYQTQTSLQQGVTKTIEWAKKQGPQQFRYLEEGMELETNDTPLIWTKKLI